MLGAKVIPVDKGTKTLTDAVDAAIEAWVKEPDAFYLIGSVVGPHPYPKMVKEFQKVIGEEARNQFMKVNNRLPDALVACVGGGSNAIGLFTAFLNDQVKIYGVEAAGKGIKTKKHAATLSLGKEGLIHGMNTIVLKDDKDQIQPVYSISPGLDYPGVYEVASENFGEEEYGVGFRLESSDIRDKINDTLQAMIDDGTASEISIRWFGEDIFIR